MLMQDKDFHACKENNAVVNAGKELKVLWLDEAGSQAGFFRQTEPAIEVTEDPISAPLAARRPLCFKMKALCRLAAHACLERLVSPSSGAIWSN